MTTRRVTWRRTDEVEADEHCTLTRRDTGLALVGTVLGSEGGVPVRIEYRVMADASGHTTAVHVRDLRGFEQRAIALERDAKGNWRVDGGPARSLRGCTDVDLGCSPSTNTLPIRRLGLRVGCREDDPGRVDPVPGADRGEGRPDLHAARRVRRTATRADRSRPSSRSTTRASSRTYAEWRRTGVAFGPEGSEPLDADRAGTGGSSMGGRRRSGVGSEGLEAGHRRALRERGAGGPVRPQRRPVVPGCRSAHAMTAPSRNRRS